MGRFRREKKNSLKFTTEEYQKKKRIRLFLLAFFSFVIGVWRTFPLHFGVYLRV